jgi:hypothetical protein
MISPVYLASLLAARAQTADSFAGHTDLTHVVGDSPGSMLFETLTHMKAKKTT